MSAMLNQGRRNSKPLDAVLDRYEQLALYRHFGHLERCVPRMPIHFGAYLDQLLPYVGAGSAVGLSADR